MTSNPSKDQHDRQNREISQEEVSALVQHEIQRRHIQEARDLIENAYDEETKEIMDSMPPLTRRKGQHAKRETGLIYFVEAVGLDRLKIGYTTGRFDARLAVIQTGSPVRIQPLLVWKNATIKDEAEVHRLFKEYRQHGEWYILNSVLYMYMRQLKASQEHDTLSWEEALKAVKRRLRESITHKPGMSCFWKDIEGKGVSDN